MFFDGWVMCPYVEGMVVYGYFKVDSYLYWGMVDGVFFNEFFKVDDYGRVMVLIEVFVECGADCFVIFCMFCYGSIGMGNGIIVKWGLVKLSSFYGEWILSLLFGGLYDIVINGVCNMLFYCY